ncbi:uncharacterized protein LOC62_07G009464 [Vanrija pseudolonga]|uniref:Uncharacterized protein n=1 Tax=Vanrija pseudolonga TaxID=143232 RepID=A0AAF1BLJ8_9TREE|nr:hypothetical protein LOC62_07G009464 [Vanrija pseudolonga]
MSAAAPPMVGDDEPELSGHRPAKRARLAPASEEEMHVNSGPSHPAPAAAGTCAAAAAAHLPTLEITDEELYFNEPRAHATDEESYFNDLPTPDMPSTADEDEMKALPPEPAVEDHDMDVATTTETTPMEDHDMSPAPPAPEVIDEPPVAEPDPEPVAPPFIPTCPMAKITRENCTPRCATHTSQQLVEAEIHATVGPRLTRFNAYLAGLGENVYTARVRKRVDNGIWTLVRLSRGFGKMLDTRMRDAAALAGEGKPLDAFRAAAARAHRAHGFALSTAMCRYLNGMSDALGRPARVVEGFRRFDGRVAALMARFKKVTYDAHEPAWKRLDRAEATFKAAVARRAAGGKA